jgi:hypothetical protein
MVPVSRSVYGGQTQTPRERRLGGAPEGEETVVQAVRCCCMGTTRTV